MGMNEIVSSISEDLGFTKKDVKAVVDSFFDKLTEATVALEVGDKVSVPGFGAWVKKEKKARVARNPKTGEAVNVPAGVSVKWKPAGEFRKLVTGK